MAGFERKDSNIKNSLPQITLPQVHLIYKQ